MSGTWSTSQDQRGLCPGRGLLHRTRGVYVRDLVSFTGPEGSMSSHDHAIELK